MSKLNIIHVPNPILRRKSDLVSNIDKEIKNLLRNMLDTMYDGDGCGLAAPQVGISLQILVVDCAINKSAPEPYMMINPSISILDKTMQSFKEGCLSLKDIWVPVKRPRKVEVHYTDINGEPKVLVAEGILASCLQHEVDHLNGILMIDQISAARRHLIEAKLRRFN